MPIPDGETVSEGVKKLDTREHHSILQASGHCTGDEPEHQQCRHNSTASLPPCAQKAVLHHARRTANHAQIAYF